MGGVCYLLISNSTLLGRSDKNRVNLDVKGERVPSSGGRLKRHTVLFYYAVVYCIIHYVIRNNLTLYAGYFVT